MNLILPYILKEKELSVKFDEIQFWIKQNESEFTYRILILRYNLANY